MFDPSAPHIIILLIVVLLLFGSSRLPGAASALGKSMHIFRKSVHGLDENGNPAQDPAAATTATTLPPPAAPQPLASQPATFDTVSQQQQLADLQRQVADLQRRDAVAPEGAKAQHSQQPF